MQYTAHARLQANPILLCSRRFSPSPVAQCRPIDGRDASKIQSRSSLSSHFSLVGLEVLSLVPHFAVVQKTCGKRRVRVEANVGAYNKEAFIDDAESQKLSQVAKRLERTAAYFKRLGSLGFWGQLICTVVSAVILAFSIVITGAATSPVTVYLTAAGIATAFLSVFWSFGYVRLSHRLRETIDDPTKAPPRAQVVKNLKNGILINLVGMAATLLGMQATVGVLVAKALTSSATPYLQGAPPGYSPVLALDVFLVQASANTLLSHFLGVVFSLELLRSVTLSQPPPENVIPKPA